MGKESRDWYRGKHPPSCNCAECVEERQRRALDPKAQFGEAPQPLSEKSREFAFGAKYIQREKKGLEEKNKETVFAGVLGILSKLINGLRKGKNI